MDNKSIEELLGILVDEALAIKCQIIYEIGELKQELESWQTGNGH